VHQSNSFLLLVQLTPVHCISFFAKVHKDFGKVPTGLKFELKATFFKLILSL